LTSVRPGSKRSVARGLSEGLLSKTRLWRGPIEALVWRAGRKLYQHARREGANDPKRNGEYRLLEAVLALAAPGPSGLLTLLDVGAHLGDWTARALEGLSRHGREGVVHAFEPTPSTLAHLTHRFSHEPRVNISPLALSERQGSARFYVVGDLVGTNSLADRRDGSPIDVESTTVDAYLSARGIGHVTFLKSDVEGHDLSVLRGGLGALSEGRIDVWQFEYNSHWVYARAFLRDVFELIVGQPYVLGKLHGGGVDQFESWHPELERYFETNFVLLRKGTPFERLARRASFDRSNVAVRARRGE
jgi:FkbM family methyltransferase